MDERRVFAPSAVPWVPVPMDATHGGGIPIGEVVGDDTGPGEASEPIFGEGEYHGRTWSSVVEDNPEYFYELRRRLNPGVSAMRYVR